MVAQSFDVRCNIMGLVCSEDISPSFITSIQAKNKYDDDAYFKCYTAENWQKMGAALSESRMLTE